MLRCQYQHMDNSSGVGVLDKAAIVQASTCFGFDNSYVTDSIAHHKGRLTGVGSINLIAPDATKTLDMWMKKGITGLRMFMGGSTTTGFDTSLMDDKRVFPVWEVLSQHGMSMCLQTGPDGLAQVAGLAKRFPKVNIILDHLARADTSDGPDYKKSVSLFAMANFENVHLKITPTVFEHAQKGTATHETFFPKLVGAFTAQRIAWGSNFPATAGKLKDNLAGARKALADVRVRRALGMVIDRQQIVDKVLRAGESPALHLTPPGTGLASLSRPARFERRSS